MGCDIHVVVERKYRGSTSWYSFGGQIHLGRDYALFGMLADGVRSDHGLGFPIKGFPDDISYGSQEMIYCDIGEGEDKVSLKDAISWGGEIEYWEDGRPRRTINPDIHSVSYLGLEECLMVLDKYEEHYNEEYVGDFQVIIAMLKEFVKLGEEGRIVFGFDN